LGFFWPLSRDPRASIGADVRVRASDGIEFRVHRAVLAARSPLFAARISAEAYTPPARARRSPAMLLVPDMTGAVLAALLEFVYTDALSAALQPTAPFTRALGFAAAQYGPPRLFALCRALLESPVAYWSRTLQREEHLRAPDAPETDGSSLVTPSVAAAAQMAAAVELSDASTALGSQLASLLLSPVPQWADVVFKAGGWRFAAHAVIIRAGSQYFRALLAPVVDASAASDAMTVTTDDDEDDDDEDAGLLEISLPDSAVTVSRLLYFLYSGALPPLPADAKAVNERGILPSGSIPCTLDVEDDSDQADYDYSDHGVSEVEGSDARDAPPKDNFHAVNSTAQDDFRADLAVWSSVINELGAGVYDAGAKKRDVAIAPEMRSFPGVDAQWTPTAQLLQDIVAADRYAIPAMAAQAASLIQGDGSSAAQILELSDLLPAVPRLKDAALTAARVHLPDMLESATLASLRVRAPHLVSVIAAAMTAHHDTAFFRSLADDANIVRPPPGHEAAPLPKDKSLSEALGFGKSDTFAWKPLFALFVACFFFLSIAEYTEANHWLVPVVNTLAIVVMAALLFYGTVK
jgi:hypothetical protein